MKTLQEIMDAVAAGKKEKYPKEYKEKGFIKTWVDYVWIFGTSHELIHEAMKAYAEEVLREAENRTSEANMLSGSAIWGVDKSVFESLIEEIKKP